ncbi:TPA: hypothetical protein PBL59_002724 [Staphylococcus aureus]|uniref:hypothetical protein n=1 Tax=Staphylococcus aureus TaxID=1280 RepID=UPI0003F3CE22|nr:hypothetical protein [Staphylococcus aureus]ETO54990.1 hypothetical protein Y002_08050 [Staphylococcus aureus MUM270]EKK3049182.1 hypothetical protein [Staphylococcus aureus]MBG3837668.1 hypothetical protein [Staphylococcus aureus]MEB6802483.1 hypothetical protein [Staphylococcus aureus]WRN22766.1 hypothetical protein UM638_07720 [Staphylococcus aureus]
MKIKVEKEMTLDGLIKWARENPELSKGKSFFTTGGSDGIVRFQKDTNECTTSVCVPLDAPFEVKVEEEITEETVIPKLVKMYKDGKMSVYNDYSIKRSLLYSPKAYYILNDDLTMTLIWKDGELVE